MKACLVTLLLFNLVGSLACGASLSTSAGDSALGQNNRKPVNGNNKPIEDSTEPVFPPVLAGSLGFADREKGNETELSTYIGTEIIEMSLSRGIDVRLPSKGTTVMVDVMNCRGFVETAEVSFHGLEEKPWTARLNADADISDLTTKLENCVEEPKSSFNKRYLSNMVYLLFPSKTDRRNVKNVNHPDLRRIIHELPYEWRRVANLKTDSSERQLNECITDWLDSNGDGKVDILTM